MLVSIDRDEILYGCHCPIRRVDAIDVSSHADINRLAESAFSDCTMIPPMSDKELGSRSAIKTAWNTVSHSEFREDPNKACADKATASYKTYAQHISREIHFRNRPASFRFAWTGTARYTKNEEAIRSFAEAHMKLAVWKKKGIPILCL